MNIKCNQSLCFVKTVVQISVSGLVWLCRGCAQHFWEFTLFRHFTTRWTENVRFQIFSTVIENLTYRADVTKYYQFFERRALNNKQHCKGQTLILYCVCKCIDRWNCACQNIVTLVYKQMSIYKDKVISVCSKNCFNIKFKKMVNMSHGARQQNYSIIKVTFLLIIKIILIFIY